MRNNNEKTASTEKPNMNSYIIKNTTINSDSNQFATAKKTPKENKEKTTSTQRPPNQSGLLRKKSTFKLNSKQAKADFNSKSYQQAMQASKNAKINAAKSLNNKPKTKFEPRTSLNKVNELLEKTPNDIILALYDPHFNINIHLNAERMGPDLIFKVVSLIEKALECNSFAAKLSMLINTILSSTFFTQHVYNQLEVKRPPSNMAYNIGFILQVLKIINKFVYIDPYVIDKLGPFRDRFELLIELRIRDQDPNLVDEWKTFHQLEQIAKEKKERRKNNTFSNVNQDSLSPPNNFTEMSIVPSLGDIIQDQEIFLRRNLTNGAYASVNHYLDVQFRLLREDFIYPLRNGVKELKQIVKDAKLNKLLNINGEMNNEVMRKIKKIESLNVYFNVRMSSSVTADLGIVYAMRLDMEKMKAINWECSKRLIFGSLICFSFDHFESNCLFGIVCERDDKKLKKNGEFYVKFDQENFLNNLPVFSESYIMLETSAFFESYKHVLEALVSFERLGEKNFPFKENLIHCQNTIIPIPKYLANAFVDFRPLIAHKSTRFDIKPDVNGFPKYFFSKEVEYAEKCLVSNKDMWPSAEQFSLDQSQYEAVRLALQSKLALIQGPPGTGKTFIGVKIVQLLLHNRHTWWNKDGQRHKPILMICYTNHALDQFLEYCIKVCNITKGVVRVGGRSKMESLNNFLLSNIKYRLRGERRIDRNIFRQIKDEYNNLNKMSNSLNNMKQMQNLLFNGEGLLSFNKLAEYMSEKHKLQFEDVQYKKEFNKINDNELKQDYSLLKWLGLISIEPSVEKVTRNLSDFTLADERKNAEDAETNQFTNEEDPNIEDDTDSLNEERMLEDDGLLGYNKNTRIKKAFDLSETIDRFHHSKTYIDSKTIDRFREGINGGWQMAKSKNKKKKSETAEYIKKLMHQAMNYKHDPQAFEHIETIWSLNQVQRFVLYLSWLSKFNEEKNNELEQLSRDYNVTAAVLKDLRLQEDRSIMEDALIIAMTTTGASRYHTILKDIGPRIVIVEEAAEVFEAHIVSALSKDCEHLILIGDHVQLRPNPAVYRMAKEYKLDVSLFERLINNNAKRVMLKCQHRMRPEISTLMRHFYNEPILDHESVMKFENIIGLKKNVFFLSHKQPERKVEESTSKINMFEVTFLSKFCVYLTKQKYQMSQITVLTMYLGQMAEIKKKLKENKMEQIKVTTVDNYQGEENDIILLSLVRSNSERKIGFLEVKNRVCVALSRAKKGFFCIGDFNMIADKSDTWAKLVQTMKENEAFGDSLALTCGSHPHNDIEAKQPSDFDLRPDGGCLIPCNTRLNCGHVCPLKCHRSDHNDYKCQNLCNKTMPCGHKCAQVCSHTSKCDRCAVQVTKIVTECGHSIRIRCDKTPTKYMCTKKCQKMLLCGHLCEKLCPFDCFPCIATVQKKSKCKHDELITTLCKEQNWNFPFKCNIFCDQVLKCGHMCTSKCGECSGGLIHQNCTSKCGRILFCGHKCQKPCPEQCTACQKKCENKCVHSKCPKKCSELCVPCRMPCSYNCEHYKCNKGCGEICERPPCDAPCSKKVRKCGHSCIGICGEPCPNLCRICDKEAVTETFFGDEDEPDARFVLLEDCNHVLEVKGMDYWIKSRFGDEQNREDQAKNNSIELPNCPKCKTPIRLNLRYSNFIKKQLMSIEQIKTKQLGNEMQNNALKVKLLSEIKKSTKYIGLSQTIKENLEHETPLTYNEINTLSNVWTIYNRLQDLKNELLNKLGPSNMQQVEHLEFAIGHVIYYLFDEKRSIIFGFNDQRLSDLLNELDRIEAIYKYYQFTNAMKKNDKTHYLSQESKMDVLKCLSELEKMLINRITSFDEKSKSEVDKYIVNLKNKIDVITEKEKMEIVRAIGLSKGHWFKCPNGHVYCIGECGGAMEKSKCPECKSDIGGSNHALLQSNSLAPEMDGAQFSAWSETANNMANWRF